MNNEKNVWGWLKATPECPYCKKELILFIKDDYGKLRSVEISLINKEILKERFERMVEKNRGSK